MKHRFRFSRESMNRVDKFSREVCISPAGQEETLPAEKETKRTFIIETRTNVGLIRVSNQDAVIQGSSFIGVADGMGGHNGGETASSKAKECIESFLKDREPDPIALTNAIRTTNRKIYLQAMEDSNLTGMGTTLTLMWVGPEMMYIAHVGDSRCYCLRNHELKQLTNDHSLVMEMVRAGMITKEQAEIHPMRNVITKAVGTDEEVEPDLIAHVRNPGDIWLICSDGLHGLVSDEKITEILSNNSLSDAADLLLQSALNAGGRDNISLALLLDQEGHNE